MDGISQQPAGGSQPTYRCGGARPAPPSPPASGANPQEPTTPVDQPIVRCPGIIARPPQPGSPASAAAGNAADTVAEDLRPIRPPMTSKVGM